MELQFLFSLASEKKYLLSLYMEQTQEFSDCISDDLNVSFWQCFNGISGISMLGEVHKLDQKLESDLHKSLSQVILIKEFALHFPQTTKWKFFDTNNTGNVEVLEHNFKKYRSFCPCNTILMTNQGFFQIKIVYTYC